MENLLIKQASATDVEIIAPLFDCYRQFYGETCDLDAAHQFLQQRQELKESILLFAQSNSKTCIGFCQIYPLFSSSAMKRIYLLNDLFVAAEYRKLGIGKKLLEAAHQHAAVNNIFRLELSTAKSNLTAQSLYEADGWMKDDIFLYYSKNVSR